MQPEGSVASGRLILRWPYELLPTGHLSQVLVRTNGNRDLRAVVPPVFPEPARRPGTHDMTERGLSVDHTSI